MYFGFMGGINDLILSQESKRGTSGRLFLEKITAINLTLTAVVSDARPTA